MTSHSVRIWIFLLTPNMNIPKSMAILGLAGASLVVPIPVAVRPSDSMFEWIVGFGSFRSNNPRFFHQLNYFMSWWTLPVSGKGSFPDISDRMSFRERASP